MTDAAEVIYKNMNVWADLSGLMVGDDGAFASDEGREAAAELGHAIQRAIRYSERPNRFLYGTDWPLAPDDRRTANSSARPCPRSSTSKSSRRTPASCSGSPPLARIVGHLSTSRKRERRTSVARRSRFRLGCGSSHSIPCGHCSRGSQPRSSPLSERS